MKKPATKKRSTSDEPCSERSWTPLFVAFRDACEWALDVAAALARGYPEEVETVERVRAFLRARLGGETTSVSVDDVMFVFGLLLAAIERDVGPIGARAAWRDVPFAFHFPPADGGSPQRLRRVESPLRVSITQPQFIH